LICFVIQWYGSIINVMILHFYRRQTDTQEDCYNVEISGSLSAEKLNKLKWLLAETFEPKSLQAESFFNSSQIIVEVGPRLNFATAYSTNAVGICQGCGLSEVIRIEKTRRYLLTPDQNKQEFLKQNHDRMTECEYNEPLKSFAVNIEPQEIFSVLLIEQGKSALVKINQEMGLGMDEWDIDFYYNLFVNDIKRNPTNVECFQLGQANSEHSRHWFFKGKIVIDNKECSEDLFSIIQSTLKANPDKSIIAFKDNSSAIEGNVIKTIVPQNTNQPSKFVEQVCKYHIIMTAETHNFPSGVAPFAGAETGTGGRIRDVHATGSGSLVVAGTAGFCTGNLNFSDYKIAGEDNGKFNYPDNLASPKEIMIQESNGAYDYGNKFGEPCIQGFTRTFGLRLPTSERREWIKPIMFSGGLGQIDDRHTTKQKPQAGMLIIQIGGPAYRIGIGGGSASSMVQGANKAELDFNAVQRGDAQMKQKVNRVIRSCVEMGEENPILSIHDQGAGGPCNVLTELVEPVGGKVDIRKIVVGDKTMSVLEIWGGEYQERDGLLLNPDRLDEFIQICDREKVNCEVLGEVDNSGKITLIDSEKNNTPVELELEKILGKMPQKTFKFEHKQKYLDPVKIPEDLSLEKIIEKVFSLPSVGSKEYLVNKVDRSVTGLIVQQQCCGSLQLPVNNVSVIQQSHFSKSGSAIAVGEQPIKMLIDSCAGARMALGETITNIMWAKIGSLKHIKASVNWMWAAKLPNEGAEMYDAVTALRDLMVQTGVSADGGKDSLSMAAQVENELVKSPGEMTISAYASMEDISKKVTVDIKEPGASKLLFINLSKGKERLGGSALAQAFGQIGNVSPDVDDPLQLTNAFKAIQELINNNLILAGHDRSDGGLLTCLVEMAMSGNCGIVVNFDTNNLVSLLFNEELGVVIEYKNKMEIENQINQILNEYNLDHTVIGNTLKYPSFIIQQNNQEVLNIATEKLLQYWRATSLRIEQEQVGKSLANQLAVNITEAKYDLSFVPELTSVEIINNVNKPKVAIIREEGSNGDREMTSAFYMAGFETWDVSINDLIAGKINLDQFRGVAFVGGFSYADVLDSAKGWAGKIKFNLQLKEKFDRFYNRPDTFSFGVCNGCQLMALLGWVPFAGIESVRQPRFITNASKKFESRWVNTKITESPAIMFKDMAGSSLGVWVAHGEGKLHCPDQTILDQIKNKQLAPMVYVDNDNQPTEKYPFNPNGSPEGIASLCSPDGRHLALMPHPERVFLLSQWPYLPENLKKELKASPWLKMFQNAREWCD